MKLNYKLIYIFLMCLFLNLESKSQIKQLLKQGVEANELRDFSSAAQIYNQIILIDSSKIEYQLLFADASRLNYDNETALHWYQKIFKKDNGKKYKEVPFYIATLLKNTGKYKEAKKYFDKYYKKNKSSKDAFKKQLSLKAMQEIDACDLAQIIIKNPVEAPILHLDSAVNSKVSEYAPYEVDTFLYFSSLRDKSETDERGVGYNKLYTSKKINNKHQKATELDSLFNKEGIHNANTCFNNDFTKIIVTRCKALNKSQYTCEMYESHYLNNTWTELKKLPSPINIDGINTTHPNIGKINNKDVLLFSSNRPGGEGGMDIWYSFMNTDGTYEKPINAGKKINTIEDEITPFYVKEINTLYFSSTWHKGLGNFDIFKSEFKVNEFTEPENVGYPINSSYNDIYYSVNSKKDKAYISSNRIGSFFEDKPSCCNDIYSFSIPPLTEPIKPIDTTELLINQLKVLCPLTLYFHNDEPEPKTKVIVTKKNYKKTYDDYTLLKNKYISEYTKGNVGEQKEYSENRILNFFEDSLDAGMQDLEKFASLLESVLKRNEKVKITMKGFCSPLASTDYNVNLAKRRISSLQNYFIEYKDGMFLKYINNYNEAEGRIEFFNEDIGELPVSNVSDDVNDIKNSVYSPSAASERKIQIIAISFLR
jgi:tetratricopeptide (TPR) repeat protein